MYKGARPYGLGHVGNAQYTTVSGRVNIAHTPSVVRLIIICVSILDEIVFKIMCLFFIGTPKQTNQSIKCTSKSIVYDDNQ